MAGRVQDKVAVITGAARGMGLGFALRLAEEGADIIALDLVEDDLAEVTEGVLATGRRVVARAADVRDFAGCFSIMSTPLQAVYRFVAFNAAAVIHLAVALSQGFPQYRYRPIHHSWHFT